MSEGGTDVGSIVAYLRIDRSDWSRGIRDARREAEGLGRLSPSVRFSTNAPEVAAQLAAVRAAERGVGSEAGKAKPFVVSLYGALAAVAPAAVPIAAVAGGALAGLIPVAATVALGIAGIRDEMKSGALAGTQYGQDISQLQDWLSQLKTTAAGGLLDGIDRAVQQSSPLFGALNDDVGTLSSQLGDIVAGAAPALLSILNDLNPLFTTFGTVIGQGAAGLEHWAQSSTGVSSFVSYVQAELPDVIQLLGGILQAISHLAQGAAPFGGVLLHDINAFVGALDAIPVNVLRVAIPLAVSLYAAFKTYGAVAAIVRGVNAAVAASRAPFATSALVAVASARATEAAVAQEAATVARSKAEEAAAAETAAVDIAAAVEATSSVLAEGAVAAAEASIEFAAAMEREAIAAETAAAQIAAASTAAADAVVAEGRVAAVGWSSFLGPIGAVIVGVGLVATTFLHSGASAQTAAANIDSYTEAIKADSGALAENTREAVANALQKSGAFADAKTLGISLDTLTASLLGNAQAAAIVKARLDAVAGSFAEADSSGSEVGPTGPSADVNDAYQRLTKTIGEQGGEVRTAAGNYRDMQTAIGGSGGAAAAAAATIAQLDTALQDLAQTELAQVQSEDAFKEGLLEVADAAKQNGTSLSDNTKKGLANRDMLAGLFGKAVASAQAAQKNAEAHNKGAGALQRNTQRLSENVRQIEATARAAGYSTPQVKKLVAELGLTPKDIATKFDLQTLDAIAKASSLQDQINAIRQGNVPGLDANTAAANAKIADLQARINALQGKTVNLTTNVVTTVTERDGTAHGNTTPPPKAKGRAHGGPIVGPGGPTEDRVPIMASAGEFMSTTDSATRNMAALAAGNAGATLAVVRGYAKGGQIEQAKVSNRNTVTRDIVYRVGSGYGFQGTYYPKRKDADAARRDYIRNEKAARIFQTPEEQDETVDRTLSHGAASGVATILRSQIPESKQAMRDLAKAVNGAFQLDQVKKTLTGVLNTLKDMKAYEGQIESNVRGTFDSTQYGSIGGLITGLGGATVANEGEAGEIKKLRGEGLSKGYLNQLIAGGQTSVIDLLAGGSKGDIGAVNKALGSYNTSVGDIGNQAVIEKFGKSIAAQDKIVQRLEARAKAEQATIRHLTDLVSAITKRPTIIEIDGQKVYESSAKRAKRDHVHANGRHPS